MGCFRSAVAKLGNLLQEGVLRDPKCAENFWSSAKHFRMLRRLGKVIEVSRRFNLNILQLDVVNIVCSTCFKLVLDSETHGFIVGRPVPAEWPIVIAMLLKCLSRF